MGAWLMALIGPLGKQLLVALGIGVVTYAGVDIAVSSMLANARAAWAGGPGGAAAQLIAMAGVNTALGIIAGGITGRVTMLALKKFALI